MDTLKQRLSVLEVKKNSRNSSVPPSQDENRPKKTKSLRKPTNRKPGGQPGHEGNTLKMVQHPDQTVKHQPDKCDQCGYSLGCVERRMVERRQVVDLPPIQPEYTEHQVFEKKCSCGHVTTAPFPAHLKPNPT